MKGATVIQAFRSIIVLSMMALPVSAASQALSLDDKIKYILEVCNMEQGIDTIFQQFRPLLIEQLKTSPGALDSDVAERIGGIVSDELGVLKPQIKNFITDLYKQNLSGEEINALYDFYKSPIGSSAGRKMAKASEDIFPQIYGFLIHQFEPRIKSRIAQDEKLRNVFAPRAP